MSEPKRLRDQPATPLARALYDSLDLDRPKSGARGRALAAVGVGVAAGAAASTAAKAGAATAAAAGAAGASGGSIAPVAAKLSSAALLKWLGVLAVGGAASVAVVRLSSTYGPSAAAPTSEASVEAPLAPPSAAPWRGAMPAPTAAPAEDAVEPPEAPSSSAEAEAPPAPSASHAAASTTARPAAPRATPLQQQTEALDKARAALAEGDAKKALATLDDLDRRRAAGPLGEETTVLRIETLFASGDRASGEALARRFLREHPNSAYAQRVASRLKQSTSR